MGTTPTLGFRFPDTGVTAKGPEATEFLARDIEAAYLDTSWSTYTPVTTADGGLNPSGLGMTGRYKVRNGVCQLHLYAHNHPASPNGGLGNISLSLPVTSAPVEQNLLCKMWTPVSGCYRGLGIITPSSLVIRPEFPNSATEARMLGYAAAVGTNTPGTGRPQVPGQWTIQGGGNFHCHGRYLVA